MPQTPPGSKPRSVTVIPRLVSLFQVSSLPWNRCPACRGITVHLGVEYAGGRPNRCFWTIETLISVIDIKVARAAQRRNWCTRAVQDGPTLWPCGSLWSRRARFPTRPCGPVGPVTPLAPANPVGPCGPVAPVAPLAPANPVRPCGPVAPVAPLAPANPTGPCGPVVPVAPLAPVNPVGP